MAKSGYKKINAGGALKSFIRISSQDAEKLLEMQPDENIVAMSFGRVHKSFIVQLDSNLYLTNKRVAIISGNKLLNIWPENIRSVELVPSNFVESLYMMNRFDSFKIIFDSQEKDNAELRYWCSSGVIGGPPTPDNEKTKEVFTKIKALADSK